MDGMNADRFGHVLDTGSFARAILYQFTSFTEPRGWQSSAWYRSLAKFSQQFDAKRLCLESRARIPSSTLHEQRLSQSTCPVFCQVHRHGPRVGDGLRQLCRRQRNGEEAPRSFREVIAVPGSGRIIDECAALIGIASGRGDVVAACDQNEVGVAMRMGWNLCRQRIRDAVRERYPVRLPRELQVTKEGVVGKDEHEHSLNHQPTKHVEAVRPSERIGAPEIAGGSRRKSARCETCGFLRREPCARYRLSKVLWWSSQAAKEG